MGTQEEAIGASQQAGGQQLSGSCRQLGESRWLLGVQCCSKEGQEVHCAELGDSWGVRGMEGGKDDSQISSQSYSTSAIFCDGEDLRKGRLLRIKANGSILGISNSKHLQNI